MPDKSSVSPEDEYFAKEDLEKLKRIRAQRDQERAARAADAKRVAHWMKCPKCGSDLKETTQHNIAVDVCTGCGGVWFDAGELDTLLGARESAVSRLLRSFRAGYKLDAAPNDAPGGLEKK